MPGDPRIKPPLQQPARPLTPEAWRRALDGDPALKQAYERLTPEQRQMLDRLAAAHPNPDGTPNADLLTCLRRGTLSARDRQGRTTLEHLNTLEGQRVQAPLEKGTIFRELVGELAEPGRNAQRTRGTCVATSIQYIHATEHPADFARVMVGLVKEGDGDVEMAPPRGGGPAPVMRRNASGLPPDNSGRSSIDRIYQSSMMDFCNGVDTYDNNAGPNNVGQSTTPEGNTYGGIWDRQGKLGLSAITGESYDDREQWPLRSDRGARTDFESDLRRELQAGRRVMVSMTWSSNPNDRDANHELVIVGVDEQYVYLRNPWGDGDQGGNDPPRERMRDRPGGVVRMRKEDFYARINGTVSQHDERGGLRRWFDHQRDRWTGSSQGSVPEGRPGEVVPVPSGGLGLGGAFGLFKAMDFGGKP